MKQYHCLLKEITEKICSFFARTVKRKNLATTNNEWKNNEFIADHRIDWLEKQANAGDPQALFELGLYYLESDYITWNGSVGRIKKVAEKGYIPAQIAMSEIEGATETEEEAFSWLLKAAKQGDAEAQYRIAMHYANGMVITKDLHEAFLWFSQSAKSGHTEALCELGICYQHALTSLIRAIMV